MIFIITKQIMKYEEDKIATVVAGYLLGEIIELGLNHQNFVSHIKKVQAVFL